MRQGGQILAKVLDYLAEHVQVGHTPKQLSLLARQELSRLGGEPAFLGFEGYPDVICISVNEQVQHSIPNDRPLKEGDVVNFDFGVRLHGMVTDAGLTVAIGKIGADEQRLLEGTKRALEAAINTVRDGVKVGDVSAVIEKVLTGHRLGIVRELVGHGVGYELHEYPEIPNYGHAGSGPMLRTGMTIAIEPIANLGSPNIVIGPDGWTIVTGDGTKSAQFEHTLLVTDDGCEVLTQV